MGGARSVAARAARAVVLVVRGRTSLETAVRALLLLLAVALVVESIVQFVELVLMIQVPNGRSVFAAVPMALTRNPRVSVSAGVQHFSVREFSRVCCEYGATVFRGSTHRDERSPLPFGMGERGLYSYAYALKQYLKDGPGARVVSVFVPIAMIKDFYIDFFSHLPRGARVVLVTGQEDCGPMDVFGHGRPKCDVHMPVTLRDFLGDPRLVRWFAQNYDLGPTACDTLEEHVGCKALQPPLAALLLAKTEPLPIGIDFHSEAEKHREPSRRFSPAAQEQQLRDAAAPNGDWGRKQARVMAAFRAEAGKPDRFALQRALGGKSACVERSVARLTKTEFWARQAQMQFVLCPRGNGLDLHRVYEALALGVVPVVRASPLDALYRELPIVILDAWEDFDSCDALARWREDVLDRFGPRPFEHRRVQELQTLDYWRARVAQAVQEARLGLA